MGDLRESPDASPPRLSLWLLRVFAWLAPPDGRAEWNARWSSRLWNLWILIERGELASRAEVETVRLCGDAIRAAFWMRFNQAALHRWLRGPWAVLSTGGAALAVLALISRGFRGLRELISTTWYWTTDPRTIPHDPRADLVVGHFVTVTMALLVGAVLVLIGGRALGKCGWRYWLYLGGKLAVVAVLEPLLWIEGSAVIRAHTLPDMVRVTLVTAFMLLFFGAFGSSVIWIFADQRRRCPVCLGSLGLPVTFGSWASVLDPAITEMVCDEGHATLSLAENEMGGEDRWIKLDASWREL